VTDHAAGIADYYERKDREARRLSALLTDARARLRDLDKQRSELTQRIASLHAQSEMARYVGD